MADQLNEEQELALAGVLEWLDTPEAPFFVLSGSAGTGKTFTCKAVYASVRRRVAFTAPTNKAVKVLRKTFEEIGTNREDFATIYSLLGLRLTPSGEVKEIRSSSGRSRAKNYGLIIVDEGSMVNTELMSHILDLVEFGRMKVLFMGDPIQLPPVGESVSPIWQLSAKRAHLHRVMRHDNQILALCTQLRDRIEQEIKFKVATNTSDREGVFVCDSDKFEWYIREIAAKRQDFQTSETKVIAWRNKTVNWYNDVIRHEIFGENSLRYEEGERVVFAGPLTERGTNPNGDDIEITLASTDDEGSVLAMRNATHPLYPIAVVEIDIMLDSNDSKVTALVLDETDRRRFDAALKALAEAKNWYAFWQMKDAFNDIRYAYAITAHRAQGSTYRTVFVDMNDVFANRNTDEAWKAFYVACSRPSKILVLGGR